MSVSEMGLVLYTGAIVHTSSHQVFRTSHIQMKTHVSSQCRSSKEFTRETQNSALKFTNTVTIHTTTVHILNPPSPAAKPFIIATLRHPLTSTTTTTVLHPLTSKPNPYTLPPNFNLSKLNPTTLALSRNTYVSSFDKLLVVPTSVHRYNNQLVTRVNKVNISSDKFFLLGLRHGGRLFGCSKYTNDWVSLSCSSNIVNFFDDIAVFESSIYAVDRDGRFYILHITPKLRKLTISKIWINTPLANGSSRFRIRLVAHNSLLYLVVRFEEKLFKVYLRSDCVQDGHKWCEVHGFYDWQSKTNRVLFLARDCCFFRPVDAFLGKEFENCIVFCEGAFPVYGSESGCWEFPRFGDVCRCDDDIAVFRLDDKAFGRQGEDDVFPKLDWSPSPWVFDACSAVAAKSPPQSSLKLNRELDGDKGKKDKAVQTDFVGQEREQEAMTSASDIQDRDENMQCDLNGEQNEDEEVSRTLLKMSGGSGQGTLSKNITQLIPSACTTKSHENGAVTTKFEGLDVMSDLVPTLQLIWRNHGNIIENSSIRSGDLIARALESLATMVRILENNSVQSLSSSQADFLSSTLFDLRYMHFKVDWLIPFVEKVVKLHESKHLVDSLNNLSQLSSQAKKRKAILMEEVSKIDQEENKRKEEMTKVSKMIPFSGQVEFDKPVGSGLTRVCWY